MRSSSVNCWSSRSGSSPTNRALVLGVSGAFIHSPSGRGATLARRQCGSCMPTMRWGAMAMLFGLTQAIAADPPSVKQPYVEVGDCWTYASRRSIDRAFTGNYELCVTHVDSKNDKILAVATIKPD